MEVELGLIVAFVSLLCVDLGRQAFHLFVILERQVNPVLRAILDQLPVEFNPFPIDDALHKPEDLLIKLRNHCVTDCVLPLNKWVARCADQVVASQRLVIFKELAEFNVGSFVYGLEAKRTSVGICFNSLRNTGHCYFTRFVLALDTSNNHPLGDFKGFEAVQMGRLGAFFTKDVEASIEELRYVPAYSSLERKLAARVDHFEIAVVKHEVIDSD